MTGLPCNLLWRHSAAPIHQWRHRMLARMSVAVSAMVFVATSAHAGLDPKKPTWWEKYQFIQNGGVVATEGPVTQSIAYGSNVDMSNECGPQSETNIAMFDGRKMAGGSNEIFRLPMRAYFS